MLPFGRPYLWANTILKNCIVGHHQILGFVPLFGHMSSGSFMFLQLSCFEPARNSVPVNKFSAITKGTKTYGDKHKQDKRKHRLTMSFASTMPDSLDFSCLVFPGACAAPDVPRQLQPGDSHIHLARCLPMAAPDCHCTQVPPQPPTHGGASRPEVGEHAADWH